METPGLRRLAAHSDSTLTQWALRYLHDRVQHGPRNTFDAKSRDLAAFTEWFVSLNGHGDIRQWLPRDTQLYLKQLEQTKAPSSVNRSLATLRHFARWAHEQPGGVFLQTGLPTAGVHDLGVDEGDCKKLERREIHALFKAADQATTVRSHARARPRRNRAILALLYHTGLRVTEIATLRHEQYQDGYLLNVTRKGRTRSRRLYLVADCRRALEDYLAAERIADDGPWLFLTPKGHAMDRRDVGRMLDRLAAEASVHREPLAVHPHMLRHTFGSEYRAKSGSDTETAQALGHKGLRHVGRYVRKSEDERNELLESLYA